MKTAERILRRGMTLIELLVVMGIIGLLVGLLLPAVQAARESARRAQCASRMGQMIRATLNYKAVQGGFPSWYFLGKPFETGVSTNGGYSIHCCLLPFLEQGDLYDGMNFRLPGYRLDNIEKAFHQTAATHRIATFLCPSDPLANSGRLAPTSYRGCMGLGDFHKIAGVSHAYRVGQEGAFQPPKRSDGQPDAYFPGRFP